MSREVESRTARLLIRELRPDDAQAFIDMASDGSLGDIFGDCRECRRWMGRWIEEARALYAADDPRRDYLAYAVETLEDHMVIGSVGSTYYEDIRQVGVTYFTGAAFRGRGYMTEALRAFTAYFLRTYPVGTLCAAVRTDNTASWKTLEKAGFVRTETKLYRDIYDEEEKWYHFYQLNGDPVIEKGGTPSDL